MLWDEWKNLYYQIVANLNISSQLDENSSEMLSKYLISHIDSDKTTIESKLSILFKNSALIIGAGPSLDSIFEENYQHLLKLNKITLISIDGATTALKELLITPQIIFSDLDGDLESIFWAVDRGAILIVHAHGDNTEAIEYFFDKLENKTINKKNIWGSTQAEPNDLLLNYGGFTDGDRALVTAIHFDCPTIGLIGFDFGEIIGKYSFKNSLKIKNVQWKLRKMKWGKKIIEYSLKKFSGKCFNLTTTGDQIEGVKRLSIVSFLNPPYSK